MRIFNNCWLWITSCAFTLFLMSKHLLQGMLTTTRRHLRLKRVNRVQLDEATIKRNIKQLQKLFSGCLDYTRQRLGNLVIRVYNTGEALLPPEMVDHIMGFCYRHRAVDLAKRFLRGLPNGCVNVAGFCFILLPHLLPLIMKHWSKFSVDSHRFFFSLVYFSTDFKTDVKMNPGFTAAIRELVSKMRVDNHYDEPPPSRLLEYALGSEDVDLLQSILTNQPHARRWVVKYEQQAKKIAGNNIHVHALIAAVKINFTYQ